MRVTRPRFFLLAASILFLIPCVLTADTLSGGGGSWQSGWTQAQLYGSSSPTPGTPYWNNASGDNPGPRLGNIGWCLTGGNTVCNVAGDPGTLPYYGLSSGGAVSDMFFTSSGVPLTLSILGIHTDQTSISNGLDIFGYYVLPASGSPTLVPLFNTSQAGTGSTTTLDLSSGTAYGFYLENIHGPGGPDESDIYFLTNSGSNYNTYHGSTNPGPDSYQHFAVFQTADGYIVGDVDGYACPTPAQQGQSSCIVSSEFDYNDVIVGIAPAAPTVPEPATLGLIGVSGLLLAVKMRRKLQISA